MKMYGHIPARLIPRLIAIAFLSRFLLPGHHIPAPPSPFSPSFPSLPTPILAGLNNANAAVLIDLDRDGLLDLAYSEGNEVRIARNPGEMAGQWGTTWSVGTAPGTIARLVGGDLDQDGRPDLVSISGATTQIWLNPATPQTPGETFASPWTLQATLSAPDQAPQSALTLSDLDGDGALDIATGGTDGTVHLWQNPRSASWSIRRTLAANNGFSGPIRDLAAEDLNHDSEPDLIVTGGSTTASARLWRNPGNPFTASWNTTRDLIGPPGLEIAERTLSLADLNGDHRHDVVVGGAQVGATSQSVIYAWEQPATSPFVSAWRGYLVAAVVAGGPPEQTPSPPTHISGLIAIDLGHDADVEIVTIEQEEQEPAGHPRRWLEGWKMTACSEQWEMTLLGQGNTGELYATALLRLAAGDLDRDGDTDLVTVGPSEAVVWENQTLGSASGCPARLRFDTTGTSVGATGDRVIDLALADLDQDGDQDVLCGDEAGQIRVWRNDSSPFDSGWNSFLIGDGTRTAAIASGDMDGDGDMDIVVGHRGNANVVVWQNNGRLTGWGSWVIGTGRTSIGALALGDVDGDGALDIVGGSGDHSLQILPTSNNRVTIWLNRPLGQTWPAIDVGETYYAVRSVALGDIDNDGDLDIVIGTNHAPAEGSAEDPVPREEWPDVYQVRAFRNDGATSWYGIDVGRDPKFETLRYQYHGYWGASVSSVSLADLDNDGDLDIVSTGHMEGDFQVIGWENDGTPFSGPGSPGQALWTGSAIAVGPYHNWLFSTVQEAATGDLDGDGDVDVATANAYTSLPGQAEIIVWENTGIPFHDVFSRTHWLRHDVGEFAQAVNAVAVQVADLDLDGNLDLASAAHTDSLPYAIMVWRNTTNRAPDVPACPSPPSGAINSPLTTTLTWGGSDPDGDALLYTVSLGTSIPPPVVTVGVTATGDMAQYDPGPLRPHQVHYWQVAASDGTCTTSGPLWQFVTPNRAPQVPGAPYPVDGAADQPVPAELTWEGGDLDGDPLTYTIALGESSPGTSSPPPVVSTLVITDDGSHGHTGRYAPGDWLPCQGLCGHTAYYWQITATDGISTVVSPVWQFSTANRKPDAPHAPSPPDGAAGWPIHDVLLTWDTGDPDGDKLTYTVTLSTCTPLEATEVATTNAGMQTYSSTSYAAGTLLPGTAYCWQILVSDGMDMVSGPIWKFTTANYVYLPISPKGAIP